MSLEDRVFQGQKTTASASFSNTGSNAKTDVVISPELPDGWTVSNAEGAVVGNCDHIKGAHGDSASLEDFESHRGA